LMDGSGGGAGVNMVEFFMPCDNLVDGNGILMDYGQNLTVVDEYSTPEFAAVVDIFRKWYLAGYILPDAATTQENGSGMVKAGKMFSYPTMIKPGIDNQETKNCNYPMVSVTLTKASTGTFGACVFMMSITSYSKFPEQSMKFLNLMYSDPKLVNLFDYGIEGKHYVKTADGTIDYPAGIDAANTGYGLNEPYAFGNQMISYVWKGDSPDLYKQLDAFNKSVIKSKAMGFNFNNEPVKTEYASVSNVINQYKASVETGSVDPAKVLPEFIAALNAAGMQKIVAEKQKQLNAWALENNVK
jgi:putative aldouronate transport system substrate-binding protein